MKVEHVSNYGCRPRIKDDVVELPPLYGSAVIVHTDNLLAVDFTNGFEWHLHFFREGPVEVTWDDLTDDERLLVRTHLIAENGIARLRMTGRYLNKMYYALEALESL